MDTGHIATFIEVFAAGSLADVARARGVAPSTISRKVAALERELGVALFVRTTRALSPTEEGERFHARVVGVAETLDDIVAELRDVRRTPGGTLRVSASVSFGQAVIAPGLAAFRAAHPGLRIDLSLTDSRVDVVAEGLDLAIRHGHLPDSGLIAAKLREVHYHLVASEVYLDSFGMPATPEELVAHDLLTFPYPGFSQSWTFTRGTRTHEIPIAPVIRVSSALALRSCARSGAGIAILPDWALDRADLKRVLPDWTVRGGEPAPAIWMVQPARAYVPARVRAFTDHLRAMRN